MLKKIEGAIDNLFRNPTDAFYTGRAMDLLFDGVPIDCSNKADTFTAAACMQLEERDAVRKIDDALLKFSMFGGVRWWVHLQSHEIFHKNYEKLCFPDERDWFGWVDNEPRQQELPRSGAIGESEWRNRLEKLFNIFFILILDLMMISIAFP